MIFKNRLEFGEAGAGFQTAVVAEVSGLLWLRLRLRMLTLT